MRGGRVGIKASRSWRPVSASDDGGRRVEASKKIRESVPDCPPISAPHLLHASPVIARPRSAPAAQSVSEGFERGLPPGAPLPLRASAGRASRGVLPGATPLLVTGTLQKPEGFTWTNRRCASKRKEAKGRHRQITVSSRTGATRIEVWSGHQKQPFPISRSRLALPSAGSPSGSARYPIEFNRG